MTIPAAPLSIPGLSAADQDVLTGLTNRLMAATPRNMLRRKYYDHKNTLKDLGISIPPAMRQVETVVGWPSKAVDVLARRVRLDGFYLAGGGSIEDTGLPGVMDANRTLLEAEQAVTSSLMMSPAFISVTAGDVAAGEPEAIITCRSALFASGDWDARRRSLRSALSIISVDQMGLPDYLVLYLPNRAVVARRDGQRWDLRQSIHELGVPVEPLVFRPELDRPFGRSRITRGVMSITDRAVRTALRSEVSAEFFSAPQRYALGADEGAFTREDGTTIPGWTAIIGRLMTLTRDEDGNLPSVGQFTQQSFTPHLDHMRELAAEFAAETDLMPDTLGVIQDNPSSSEAIDNRKEELRLTAESCIATFGTAYNRTARTVLQMLDNSPAAMAEWVKVRSRWRNPATPSRAAAADATVKLVQSGVLQADSEVTYDGLGFSEDQREALRSERAKANARASILALAGPPTSAGPVPSGNPG